MTKLSDVLIIGGGVGGLLTALQASPRKVTILEKDYNNFELAKRILVSGNGRANFFNAALLDSKRYLDPMLSSFKDIVFSDGQNYAVSLLSYLESLGFSYYQEGDLFYPFFNRSECLHSCLLKALSKTETEVIGGEAYKVDRKNKKVFYYNADNRKEEISYKELVVSVGGRSYDRDDFSYSLLDSLSVPYYPYSPCLCPLVTKERIPSYLAKNRIKGTVSLYQEDRLISKEEGEVIFKDDGLSGISIFNLTLSINELIRLKKDQNIKIHISYLSHDNTSISKKEGRNSLPSFLEKYLRDRNYGYGEDLIFTFDSLYPFRFSQTSYGGVLLKEIDLNDMSLPKDHDIHLLGECLDQTFICGGYNMGLALIEGYKTGLKIRSKL